MRSRALCVGLVIAAASTLAPAVIAHDLGVARVELHELDTGRYRLEAKLPPVLDVVPPVFPEGCEIVGEPSIKQRAVTRLVTFEIRCSSRPLAAEDVLSLPWDREGAFAAATWLDGTTAGQYFEGSRGLVEIPISRLRAERRPAGAVATHYLIFGFEHILLGWDHLAFVLGLCLIARGWHLVKLVTAFTIGHSLTLAAAIFGLTRLPSPPVEACIALSIAFVAREALHRDSPSRHSVGLALAFGLLHGLGFAGALAESGIQRSEIFLGLVSFNIGVELGQLAFVFVVLGSAWLIRHSVSSQGVVTTPFTRPAVSWTLGILAMFWTFERVLGFMP